MPDAEKGLQYFLDFRPQLVLCDIQLPSMNGLELLTELRKHSEEVFIVMMTAYGREEYAVKALRKGANDYLKKPVALSELIKTLRKYEKLTQAKTPPKDSRTFERLLDTNITLRHNLDNQTHLLGQLEKMSSIGTLTASIAHEISNSMLLVINNLSLLSDDQDKIKELTDKHQTIETILSQHNNPNTILGKLDDLIKKEKLAQLLNDDVSILINDAMEGAMQIDVLLADLKNFTRKEKDEFTSTDLNERVDFALKMIHPRIKNKVKITKNQENLPPSNCCPQKIAQAFMNILLNAEHSIAKTGTIQISTHHVAASLNDTASCGFNEVIFTDTGCGITKNNLPYIFDPFFTTKPPGSGTGLGMKITQDIINQHNGSISIKSKEEKGTTVTISIPATS